VNVNGKPTRTIWVSADGAVEIIDQTALPHAFVVRPLRTVAEVAHAIASMQVRGAGKTAVLHNRTGSGTHNLIKSYSHEGVPALQALLGEEAQGNWTLKVIDLASQDVGKLRRWGVQMDLDTSTQVVQGEAIPALSIPDNDPTGVSSSITVAQSGSAQRIKVAVDIAHTFIGDLRVELVSPSGQQALLHDRFGGGEDNLIRTYDSLLQPALAALIGQPIQGNWELRVKDMAGRDIGKFNKWTLELSL
jgi:subtilisin-like proprotein convertase family protein